MRLSCLMITILALAPLDHLCGQDKLQKLKNAVVRVRAVKGENPSANDSTGSGAIIKIEENRVLVLTAAHVVRGFVDHIEIGTEDGAMMKAEKLINIPEHDFAVLQSLPDQVIPKHWRCLPIQKSSQYRPASPIWVAGFANISQNLSYHQGAIINVDGASIRYNLDYKYTLHQGESGSPLLDKNFNIIGLNRGYGTGGEVNKATRGDLILSILKERGRIKLESYRNIKPVIAGAVAAATFGLASRKFHSNAQSDLNLYEQAITVAELEKYWNLAEANRKRGNITALLSYSAAAFTGYQAWRYISLGRSNRHVQLYPIFDKKYYATHGTTLYGVELHLYF